ncbi:hypothetical protein ACOME3_004435 [Neoechinorhynchus agilis]
MEKWSFITKWSGRIINNHDDVSEIFKLFMALILNTFIDNSNVRALGESAFQLVSNIAKRSVAMKNDPRATAFLKQNISLVVQRGNVASARKTAAPQSIIFQNL